MEVMLEIYRTLMTLGMEWKEKKNLGGLGGPKASAGRGTNIERGREMDGGGGVDLKAASSYTSTPSSRDSAFKSAATGITSMSAASGCHSSSKGRSNSASSDQQRCSHRPHLLQRFTAPSRE
jgi:hypothetical protein